MAAPDNSYPHAILHSLVRYAAVTPSDLEANNFKCSCRAILCAVGGTVALVGEDNDVAVVPIIAGTVHWLSAKRVNATNTTATGIVAAW